MDMENVWLPSVQFCFTYFKIIVSHFSNFSNSFHPTQFFQPSLWVHGFRFQAFLDFSLDFFPAGLPWTCRMVPEKGHNAATGISVRLNKVLLRMPYGILFIYHSSIAADKLSTERTEVCLKNGRFRLACNWHHNTLVSKKWNKKNTENMMVQSCKLMEEQECSAHFSPIQK